MRPISIRFQCFGPYMAEQVIDFSQLEKNGIFLICGETGAGKTTILDAMCYALYGKSSGGLRGDLSVMRCKLAGKNDETRVEFVFDCGPKRYKFVRSLKYGRKNLNDSHNCMVLEGEEYVPIFENPKATVVNQKAQELIGLTYDQFRQVIILPQGQFEKLLVSDSAEKEKILVSLFHADRWQKIAEELYRRVTERDNQLKMETQGIRQKLREYGCESPEQLEQMIQKLRLEQTELREKLAGAQAALALHRQQREQALLEDQAFLELRNRQKQLEKLIPLTRMYDSEEQILNRGDLAEQILPQYTGYQDGKARKLRAEGLLLQARDGLKTAQQARDAVLKKQERHEHSRPEQEQSKRRITVLEEAGDLYQSLADRKTAFETAGKSLKEKQEELDRAQKAFGKLERAWQTAIGTQKRAMEEYSQAQQIYLRGIGSALAQRLEAGQPCPVCGSLEHPNPAKPIQGHISDSRLELLNQAMNRANDAVNEAMRARSQGEEQRNQAAAEYNEASRAAAVAERDYNDALARRIPGIETQKELEEQIRELRCRVSAFESADARIQKEVNDAASQYQVAQAAVEAAEEELAAASARYAGQAAVWQAALAASGLENESQFTQASLEPAEKHKRRAQLIRFRTELANARKAVQEQSQAVAGKDAPDLEGLKRQLDGEERACTESANRLALLSQRLETMEQDRKDLACREEKLRRQRIQVDEDLEFANRLRGRSGISLQRYVLGVMLTSITTAANHLLKNVCAGRYQLFRTNEIAGSGHKGGLELEVYDANNNERRSVTTLSGGEKFLVALSLAIGLSTVVQAQGSGIRLEAMFIDEGFGSLDRDSINDALEVLQSIQRGSGLVGIISHVEQLAQTIPAQIEIVKEEGGSRCRIRC